MSGRGGFLLGMTAALGGGALFRRALLVKFRRDVRRLNEGDYGPFLSAFADDAVLHFVDGDHRWAGEHVGKPAIERFLRNFTAAGLQGQIQGLWVGGPPWAMTLVARFDDRATDPDGREIYANRTALVVRTRWGRIVQQEDFYEDTSRIEAFDQRLRELGVPPVIPRDPKREPRSPVGT